MRRKPGPKPGFKFPTTPPENGASTTQKALNEVLGAPRHTDPLIVEKILTGVRLGMPEHCAAAYAGVDQSSFRDWRQRAVMFFAGDKRRASYGELFRKIELARMEAMANQLARLHKTANESGDWRAHDAALKRLFPREFGDRLSVSHEAGEQRAQELFQIIVEECGADVAERVVSRWMGATVRAEVPGLPEAAGGAPDSGSEAVHRDP